MRWDRFEKLDRTRKDMAKKEGSMLPDELGVFNAEIDRLQGLTKIYEEVVAKADYLALLDQAIRFAEMINSNPSPYADCVPEAQAFLTRHEVQARCTER